MITLIFNVLYFLKMRSNFDIRYQIKPNRWNIFMDTFIDLWPCLFTTKLSYAQLFKWGYSNRDSGSNWGQSEPQRKASRTPSQIIGSGSRHRRSLIGALVKAAIWRFRIQALSCSWHQTTNLFSPNHEYFLTKLCVMMFLMMLWNAFWGTFKI